MTNPPQGRCAKMLAKLVHHIRHDRGAVLVEAAICIPILLLVIMGAVESGIAWEAKSTTISGVRTGVLRAASTADRPETDLRIMQSVIGEVGAENTSRIEWVMVFEANGDPDAKFNACLAGVGSGGVPGSCVVYNTTVLENVLNAPDPDLFRQANFDDGTNVLATDPVTDEVTAYGCAFGELDSHWCAASRTVGGDTQLGVAIRYNHEWFTGILPFNDPTFEEYVISSTFSDRGTDGSGGPPNAGAFATNTVANLNFNAGTDLTAFSDLSFSPNAAIETSPTGEDLLGRYGTETVTIDIANQVPGTEVCISFDLLVIGSWDGGGNPTWGPDTFAATITTPEGGVSGTGANQYSGAPSTDVLGYNNGDRIVPITVCQTVGASGELSLDLVGNLIQGGAATTQLNDESWGIDNLVITSTTP